ncbi:MAG: DUF2589 domain-containing protein [Oscillospiraceae bacterium]|nr:DUF2589 domain-containing protein [Oscillospiraceae bacterium]
MNLEDLISSVSSSVRQAQSSVEKNNVKQYVDTYFKKLKDSDGSLTPVTKAFKIKSSDSSKIDVPLVSLVNHSTVTLDQVNIKMNVIMSVNSSNQIEAALTASSDNCETNMASEIELIYKQKDPAEGLARVTQETLKLI